MKRALMVAAIFILVPPALAQSSGMKGMETRDMPMKKGDQKAGEVHKGKGTVKSVDVTKGTVSLSHDPIQSMNWPAMTMTFKAKDKAMLEKVKAGAKVEFSFEQSGKEYVITDIK